MSDYRKGRGRSLNGRRFIYTEYWIFCDSGNVTYLEFGDDLHTGDEWMGDTAGSGIWADSNNNF